MNNSFYFFRVKTQISISILLRAIFSVSFFFETFLYQKLFLAGKQQFLFRNFSISKKNIFGGKTTDSFQPALHHAKEIEKPILAGKPLTKIWREKKEIRDVI